MFLLSFISFSYHSLSNDLQEVKKADSLYTIKTTFTALVGFPFPSQSVGFIDVYKSTVGGKNDYYRPSSLLSLKILVQAFPNFDLGVSIENFSSDFKDAFIDYYTINNKIVSREIKESLNDNSTPLMLLFQYTALRTSYTTYAGIGGGVSFDDIYWHEDVNSDIINDTRKSGDIYQNNTIAPAFKIYTGSSLDFDRKDQKEFLGAFHVEASFCYIFKKIKIFEKYNKIIKDPVDDLNSGYYVLPFYFSLSAGISFNLFPEFKDKNKY